MNGKENVNSIGILKTESKNFLQSPELQLRREKRTLSLSYPASATPYQNLLTNCLGGGTPILPFFLCSSCHRLSKPWITLLPRNPPITSCPLDANKSIKQPTIVSSLQSFFFPQKYSFAWISHQQASPFISSAATFTTQFLQTNQNCYDTSDRNQLALLLN